MGDVPPRDHRGKASKDALEALRALLRPTHRKAARATHTNPNRDDRRGLEVNRCSTEPSSASAAKKESVKEGPAKGSLLIWSYKLRRSGTAAGRVSLMGDERLDAAWALTLGRTWATCFARAHAGHVLAAGRRRLLDHQARATCSLLGAPNTGAYENDAALRLHIQDRRGPLQYHGPASPYTPCRSIAQLLFDAALAGARATVYLHATAVAVIVVCVVDGVEATRASPWSHEYLPMPRRESAGHADTTRPASSGSLSMDAGVVSRPQVRGLVAVVVRTVGRQRVVLQGRFFKSSDLPACRCAARRGSSGSSNAALSSAFFRFSWKSLSCGAYRGDDNRFRSSRLNHECCKASWGRGTSPGNGRSILSMRSTASDETCPKSLPTSRSGAGAELRRPLPGRRSRQQDEQYNAPNSKHPPRGRTFLCRHLRSHGRAPTERMRLCPPNRCAVHLYYQD